MHIHPCILGDGGITVYGLEYGMAFMKSFIHRLFFSYRVLHLLLYFSPQSIHVSSLTTTELATFMTLVFWQLDGRRRRWSFYLSLFFPFLLLLHHFLFRVELVFCLGLFFFHILPFLLASFLLRRSSAGIRYYAYYQDPIDARATANQARLGWVRLAHHKS